MQGLLKSYQKKLTNLSRHNRALLLLRLSAEQDLDLHELDFVLGEPSFGLIKDIVKQKKQIPLCPQVDSRNTKANELSRKIRLIKRKDDFVFEERGARDLYVGFPFVEGQLQDGSLVRAPLLFFPVQIAEKSGNWVLEQRSDAEISFNKSFLLAYSHYNKVQLSDEFLETDFAELSDDSRAFLTELYELLKISPLEINFNSALFEDKLQFFLNRKTDDFEFHTEAGQLKLEPMAVLGIFPQAGSYLVPDYEAWLNAETEPDLESFLLSRQGENKPFKEENLITPFQLDVSQELAMRQVKEGKSLVVQGPPGTGKSQLICNLIADYVAVGKRVLVVCDKKAALDVVQRRLSAERLEPFTALVHDFKNDRKDIFRQLASQIEAVDTFEQQNGQLDTVFLERNFLKYSRRIDQISAELDEFKAALFDESIAGISAKELYLNSSLQRPYFNTKGLYKNINLQSDWPELRSKLFTYFSYASKFNVPEHPLQSRPSYKDFSFADKEIINTELFEIPQTLSKLQRKMGVLGNRLTDLNTLDLFIFNRHHIEDMVDFINVGQVWAHVQWLGQNKADEVLYHELATQTFGLIQKEGFVRGVKQADIPATEDIVRNASRAFQHSISRFYWKNLHPKRHLLQKLLNQNGLTFDIKGLSSLHQKLLNTEEWFLIEQELVAHGHQPKETIINTKEIQKWLEERIYAYQALKKQRPLSNFVLWPELQALDLAEFQQAIKQLITVTHEYQALKVHWGTYFTPTFIKRLQDEKSFYRTAQQALDYDFEAISELDKITVDMPPALLQLATAALTQIEEKESLQDLTAKVENSIFLGWLEFIEQKYPTLKSVSFDKMELLEMELLEMIQQKRELSGEILRLKLRENVCKDLQNNRLGNRVSFRDLHHQTTKKKKIWPLRKVIAAHADEVFRLMPIWLASPETVSAVFPFEPYFDLVIFDEASQCFAERGLPALYRGRQVVIAGDNKQLQPSDLYHVRFEQTDEEDIPDLLIDSLLDLGARYFSQTSLKGHYRSKYLELIAFSNEHFYNNKLQLLPEFELLQRKDAAVTYHLVPGIWENQSNEVEADQILALVQHLTKTQKDKSIGIVTFNIKQQALIADKLEEHNIQFSGKESVFVKNIENVQGDERDIIIFSIGYAPNPSGKLLMNFGTLNTQGGENRLNVAVTRAREAIHVVSSILPEQLHVEDSKNEGPKLLKEYLTYALKVSNGEFKYQYDEEKAFSTSWYLKNHIQAHDPKFVKELPFADISIKFGGRYSALLLTDDDQYFASTLAKDAHAYKYEAMKTKKWPFKRLYSRNYWLDNKKFWSDLDMYSVIKYEKTT